MRSWAVVLSVGLVASAATSVTLATGPEKARGAAAVQWLCDAQEPAAEGSPDVERDQAAPPADEHDDADKKQERGGKGGRRNRGGDRFEDARVMNA